MSKQFSSMIWDYVVFIIFLVLSTLYPLWGEITGKKKQQTKANYVFATGRVSMFAMMLSIARGTLGVRAFLGYPSELYYRGSGMWETLYGLVTAYPIVCFVFVPVYCNLGITSVYQYLDLRFKSRLVRCLASASFILRSVFTLGITVYTPCIALNTVVGVPYWASLIVMTLISIMFTLLGGLKAAITADVIQGLAMICMSIGVIAQASYYSGGVDKVYKINRDNDRLQFFKFSGDITTRVDTTSAWIGQLFISLSVLGCQQNLVQRYLSMKNVKEVRHTLLANIPFIVVLFSLAWIVGMGVYATYFQCDPMEAGYIKKMDEILPFFVEDKLSYIPGCLGIFMATLFNGALCLSVSNTNSMATVTWEDFLAPLPRFKDMIDKKQLHFIKFLGVVYAFIILGVAFSVGLLSGVIESAMLTSSATTGPLVGVFFLAMLVPIANWKGASIGMIMSHIITMTIIIGSFFVQHAPDKLLPTSIEACTNETFSPWITKSETSWLIQTNPVEIGWNPNDETAFVLPSNPTIPIRTWFQTIFAMSYMWYSLLGSFVTVVIGIIVSYFTQSEEDKYDPSLLHPFIVKARTYFSKTQIVNDEENTSSQVTNSQHINHAFEAEVVNPRSKQSLNSIESSENNQMETDINEILNMSSMTESKNNHTISSEINRIQIEPKEIYRRIDNADL